MGLSPTGLFISELGAAAGAGALVVILATSGVNWLKGCDFSLWANKKTVACRTLMESEGVINAIKGQKEGLNGFSINGNVVTTTEKNDGSATLGGFLAIDASKLQNEGLENYNKLKDAVMEKYGSQVEALRTLQEKKKK